MFHQDLLKFKHLTEKFDKKEKIINQNITIRDIYIYPEFSNELNRDYGEYVGYGKKYDLVLLSTRPMGGKFIYRNIYVSVINDCIAYSLITPSGEMVNNIETPLKAPTPFTIKNIYPLMNEILKITSSRGHTQKIEHTNIYQEYLSLKRLIDQIDLLANIANEYHKKYYCRQNKDNTYSIQEDCLNKITRILLSEFSLYTTKALSMDEFSFLINAIYNIANNQLPNVHLLLSSLAVISDQGYKKIVLLNSLENPPSFLQSNVLYLQEAGRIIKIFPNNEAEKILSKENSKKIYQLLSENGYDFNSGNKREIHEFEKIKEIISLCGHHPGVPQLLNMTLYVQCGDEPKVEVFSKGRHAADDLTYEDTLLFRRNDYSRQMIEKNEEGKFVYVDRPAYPRAFLNSKTGTSISNNSVFYITLPTTAAQYIQAIDICIDHGWKYSISLLDQNINFDIENNTVIFPKQGNQILSSSSYLVKEEAKIFDTITHIDPIFNIVKHDEMDKVIEYDLSHSQPIQSMMQKDYPKLFIHSFKEYQQVMLLKEVDNLPIQLQSDILYLKLNNANLINIYFSPGQLKVLNDSICGRLHTILGEQNYSFDKNSNIVINDPLLLKEINTVCCLNGFLVENPPFGSNFRIVAQKERNINKFSNNFKNNIIERNCQLRNYFLKSSLSQIPLGQELLNKNNHIITVLNNLYQSLLQECVPSFFEEMVASKTYEQKLKCKMIIENSNRQFLDLKKDMLTFLASAKTLLNDLHYQINISGSRIMIKIIEESMTKIKEMIEGNHLNLAQKKSSRKF